MSSFTTIALSLLLALPAATRSAAADLSESSLRAADAEQMRIIVDGDAKAQNAFMHDNYIINGPSNRVLRKPVLVDMLAHGKMASDRFERTIEGTAITGNIGIVMGSEVVRPAAGSQLAETFGSRDLTRRFTNVFVFEDGAWRFLARQASIVEVAGDFRAAVEGEVKATIAAFMAGFSAAKCDDVSTVSKFVRDPMMYVTADDVFTVPLTDYEQGLRDRVCGWVGHTGVVDSVTVDALSRDVAVAAWRYHDEVTLASGETKRYEGSTLMTLVRSANGWKITSTADR